MPIFAAENFSRSACMAGVVQIRSPMLSRRIKRIFLIFRPSIIVQFKIFCQPRYNLRLILAGTLYIQKRYQKGRLMFSLYPSNISIACYCALFECLQFHPHLSGLTYNGYLFYFPESSATALLTLDLLYTQISF